MGAIVSWGAVVSPVSFWVPSSNYSSRKPVKAPAFCCLSNNENANGLSESPHLRRSGFGDTVDTPQETLSGGRKSDIRQLFSEAQRNILYLNKQRLLTAEALDKANKEKEHLLERIEKLEAEKRAIIGRDNQSVLWELLLRVDAMVLVGMISTSEAFDLRKVVMDFKSSILAEDFFESMQKSDTELLADLRHFSGGSKANFFHIVHICTEMTPVVSVGSLASYVTGISKALQKKGHLVEVILPKYMSLDLTEVQGLRKIEAESYSYFNGQLHGNAIWTGVLYGIGVTFIEPLYYSNFFNREKIYGYSDDFERFSYFSRASLDYIVKSGKQPDVLHVHNWETSVVGPLFWDIFAKQGLEATRVLLTCHQLDSQCLVQPDKLALCGLDPTRLHRPDRLQDDSKSDLVNILKGGIVYSNKVVIVSPKSSKEKIILSLSHGLEPTLSTQKEKFLVAPYGIDDSEWNPSKDKLIPKKFSPEDMSGKASCKAALQHQLALSQDSRAILLDIRCYLAWIIQAYDGAESEPLLCQVGCVLTGFMDFDLDNLITIVQNGTRNGAQFIFLGSKIPSSNRFLESLQKNFEDEAVRCIEKYDEALSHLVLAGADIILCKSYDDHVNLVPLKALKYGAAPIAATVSTDSFRHLTDHHRENGKFLQFISSSFGYMSLIEALDEIRNKPLKWQQRITDAMSKDFSWDAECCDIHVSAYTAVKNL